MTNEMIERCTKALWDDYQSKSYIKYGPFNKLMFGREGIISWEEVTDTELVIPSIAQEWRDTARICIKAMREPTDKMINACDVIDPAEAQWVKEVWQNMIDCILNDQ